MMEICVLTCISVLVKNESSVLDFYAMLDRL